MTIPLVTAGVQFTTGQGGMPNLATFTDGDPTAPHSDYYATINWGDGQTSALLVYGSGISGSPADYYVNGTHTYSAFTLKTYFVTITITDIGGTHTTVHTAIVDPPAAKPASVNDAALMSYLNGGSNEGPAPSPTLDPAALALLYGQG